MQQVDPDTPYQLPEPDRTIRQQDGEGRTHWSGKASVIAWLRSIDELEGTIEAETKVEDLIADVKCTLEQSIDGIPEKCVFEIQTGQSNTSILQRMDRLNRHGYTVYYLFPVNASNYRRRFAEKLEDVVSAEVTLGEITADGQVTIGTGIAPGMLERQHNAPWKEFYVPTYERSATCYDLGDFRIDSVRTALILIDEYLYAMREVGDGQRTLPVPLRLSKRELYSKLMNGEIYRESPVRGTP